MRTLRLGAILLVAAWCAAPRSANAELVRAWTFEQPAFGRSTLSVTDHFFVQQGPLWHLFYTHRWTPEEPYRAIGHATSADRRHWTEQAPALVVSGGDPAWRSIEVWAPCVVAWPGGGWVMALTGVNAAGSQQTGFLWSDDLETWTEDPSFPPVAIDAGRYFWSENFDNDNRDPHLHYDGGTWHLLYATRTTAGVAAIGHSSSNDLIQWTHFDPLLVVGGSWQLPDLESPGLVLFEGSLHLYYSYLGVRAQRDGTLSEVWGHAASNMLDMFSSGGELVPSGDGLFLSRIRSSSCAPDYPVLWFDSLDTSGWPYARQALTSLEGFSYFEGNAFPALPKFGDPQAARGEPIVGQGGLYWLSSRELGHEPLGYLPCSADRGSTTVGEIRSDLFPLDADTVYAALLTGTPASDSVHVLLRDGCTHELLASFQPAAPSLVTQSAVVGAYRGRTAQWRVVDEAVGPGGWIGVDELELRRQEGSVDLPPGPSLGWIRPAGGEIYAPGFNIRPRWLGSHPAGIDSFVVYVTYDGGENLVWLKTRSGSSFQFNWDAPDTSAEQVRLRVVGFGHDGVVSCLDSEPFHIGVTTDVAGDPELPPLRVRWLGAAPYFEGRVPLEAGGEGKLEVFDVRGRRIATPWRGRAGESFLVPAPAADAAGHRLARGVYFVRLACGSAAWTARFVRLPSGGR